MTEAECATGALLDMLRAHILHGPKYEQPVIGQAQDRIRMGVPSVVVEALFRRELALARAEFHQSNVIVGPWGPVGEARP